MKKHNLVDFSKPILCSIESMASPLIKSKLDVVDEKLRIINTPLAELLDISRNRSEYDMDGVMRSLDESKIIQEKIAQGIWKGEKNHPPKNCAIDRFMEVVDSQVCHKIYKYWLKKDGVLMGKVQFIPPMGDIVWRWITESDQNMAFSLRIYTPNYIKKTNANGPYIKKIYPMFPVTWDCVELPGFANVRIVNPTDFASANMDYKTNKMPDIGKATESWIIENPTNDISNIILSESSEAAHIIEDMYGISIKEAKAILSADKRHAVMKTGTNSAINVPINSYILTSIMGD